MITTPIITRLLTTTEYGRYSVFDSWLKILTIFISLELYSGVYSQGLIKFSDERKIFSSTLQGLSLTLTLSWTVIYLVFHDYWNQLFSLTTVQMLCMLTMIWATAAFRFWSNEQRVEYRYRALVIATLIISFVKPLVGIVFIILAYDKVIAYILALAIVEFGGYVVFFIVQMHRGKKFYSAKYWKYALAFNLPLVPHYLSTTVLNSADKIMIEAMIGANEAGIYSIAYAISQIMNIINTALLQTLNPWIYQKIKNVRVGDISGIAYLSLGLIAFVNLALIAIAPETVAIFAPVEYYEAIWAIPPVTMSVIFIFSYDLFARFEFYYEKTKFIMVASLIGAVLNVTLNYIFIQMFGYIAAAYTTLFCYIVYAVAHYICMRRICNIYMEGIIVYRPKILLIIYGSFLICGFVLMITYNFPFVRYSIIGVALIALLIKRNAFINLLKTMLSLRKHESYN